MPDVVCPMPRAITHQEARDVFAQVRKDMRGLSEAAWRREAARRMGVDYDTYLKAWKKPLKNAVVPPPDPPVVVTPTVPKLPKTDVVPAPPATPLTFDTARQQFKLVKKEFPTWTDAQVRRESARRMGIDYDTYLRSWKKPADYVAPKPNTARTASPPVVQPAPPRPVDEKTLWNKKTAAVGGKNDYAITWDGQSMFMGTTQHDIEGKVGQFAGRWHPSVSVKDSTLTRFGPQFEHYSDAAKWVEDNARKLADQLDADYMSVNTKRFLNSSRAQGLQNNCTSCATSYELRRRGYDVISRRMPKGHPLKDVYRAWGITPYQGSQVGNIWGGGNSLKYVRKNAWIYQESSKMPVGSRGFITVDWSSNRGSHIYNWEMRTGRDGKPELWYIDAQVGREWPAWNDTTLDRADDLINVVRVDNIPESADLNWLTGNATAGHKPTENPYAWKW